MAKAINAEFSDDDDDEDDDNKSAWDDEEKVTELLGSNYLALSSIKLVCSGDWMYSIIRKTFIVLRIYSKMFKK